jgi:hypothetical protein
VVGDRVARLADQYGLGRFVQPGLCLGVGAAVRDDGTAEVAERLDQARGSLV